MSHPKYLLNSLGLRPRKSFGQNFLIQKNIIQKTVKEGHLSKDDFVLEIGPGLGALTEELLKHDISYIGVEKDKKLYEYLKNRFTGNKTQFMCEDFLDFVLPTSKITVFGNIPYNITSPILEKLARNKERLKEVILMIPKDIALKLKAKEGKLYGPLSLLVQLHFEVQNLFEVGAANFYPQPKIQSQVLKLTPRKSLLDPAQEEIFFKIVRHAFQKRRKMLKAIFPEVHDWVTIGLNPQLRPENVTLEEFIKWSKIGLF